MRPKERTAVVETTEKRQKLCHENGGHHWLGLQNTKMASRLPSRPGHVAAKMASCCRPSVRTYVINLHLLTLCPEGFWCPERTSHCPPLQNELTEDRNCVQLICGPHEDQNHSVSIADTRIHPDFNYSPSEAFLTTCPSLPCTLTLFRQDEFTHLTKHISLLLDISVMCLVWHPLLTHRTPLLFFCVGFFPY